MNTYRVTLRAFGTSGVLLAAAAAMLATVSALVAFDGWPQVDRSGGVDSVSVTGGAGASALVVRTAPKTAAGATSTARGAAPAGFVKAAGPPASGATTGGFAAGFVKTVGPGGFSVGPLQFAPGPSPSVPGAPYGEGGPGTSTPVPTSEPNVIPTPVRNAVCGAGSSACGVTQVGNSLGHAPAVAPPAAVPQAAPTQVPAQAPVQVNVQATGPLPGS